jgi:hypothetical protein
MKKSLLPFTWCATLFLVAAWPLFLAPSAYAQFNTNDDFKISWALEARDYPELFARGLAYDPPAFGASRVMAGMDFDGDGLKEILFDTDETLSPAGPDPGVLDVFLFEATGDDTYEYVWHYSHPDPSNSLPPLQYGDIDQDGLWEIYMGIPTLPDEANDLLIFEQNEDGTFPETPTTTYSYERDGSLDFRPSGFKLDDVDGDGDIELLTLSRTSDARELVIASLAGALDEFAAFNIEFAVGDTLLGGGTLFDVDVADFDNDGLKEVWVNTWDNWSMTIFEATAPDTYELQVDLNEFNEVNDPGSHNAHNLLFVDVDDDGLLEAYFPMTDAVLYFLENTDDVSTLTGADFLHVGTVFQTAREMPDTRGGAMGDIDNDGRLDIVTSNGRDETISRIEFNGGNPADSTNYTWEVILESIGEPTEYYYPLRIADDLDGDGLNEIVIANRYADEDGQPLILVLEWNGLSTAVDDVADVPTDYALNQNYPNPFNPSTTIEYLLPTAQQVSVKVYNLMGQEVRTLVDGQMMPEGRHQTVWDGRNSEGATVASGTYLYTLEYGDVRLTKSMVLIK